ncbi:MAG: 30S ribosomal protein S8 [Candidatus Woesebacteria bacterium GW2011_GWB1_45_5]|uniref:Small ribosomal subunit protein uS8 n=1 Tax=Candidatus Woesebacteria bacterium GW2011_GWB1_45_5 TaxID=1618581 RepID=A0A0G1PV17_9BACT|nr:MAG: 30S ribosomal protein S8 [Candidatus Woesebacteria bacterium GW2011_GWB1_45_5]
MATSVNSAFADSVSESTHSAVKFRELERQAGKKGLFRTNMTNYSIGDFLIKIKNAAMARNKNLTVSSTKSIAAIAQALKKLGYLDEVKKDKDMLELALTFKNKKPFLTDLKLVSKPGLRIYMRADEIEKKKGPSIFLISSPKGIISSRQAVKDRIGGEVIAELT